MDVRIFQMKQEAPGKFMGTIIKDDRCAFQDGKVDKSLYNEVYACEREDGITLEDLFYEFNMVHPGDFFGHSMSVSDVVEIGGKAYFCDSIGFKECEWR